MFYKVKEVAEITGVTVRTLHHYDRIGLLTPAQTSQAGYRLYSEDNLEKLQQILFFREIDFRLQEIKDILHSPNFDREQALKMHKNFLLQKKKRLEKILGTIEQTLSAIHNNTKLEKQDLFGGLEMETIRKHKALYAKEVKKRWGKTNAYKDSERKTSQYTAQDWQNIQEQMSGIYQKVIAHMPQGAKDNNVQEAVAALRESFCQYFYNCTPEIFRGLGEMYISDPRFTAYFEDMQSGLAQFLYEAIVVYCDDLNEV
ncbi:MerR family transcriptional regulator [Candidatus Uabimicrobium amorphum]|uniref:MerR family transcriptional regulator n=1 Tax=Uabimicrobium amorphum TaxID=2596890 RepID=A0A5S9F602_UABAM|nr:MerR family transcriptional regulator [Candidatus Uabimicrobium amorphum]BBM86104.1 MerR family transcriptional regulator [Candidatus Uabimicrobium amorphum]